MPPDIPAESSEAGDEPMPAAPPASPAGEPEPDPGYSSSGVPTFDSVREKIEGRYGTAQGAAELDADTPEGRDLEEQYDARQRAAAERLEQIRRAMRDSSSADS